MLSFRNLYEIVKQADTKTQAHLQSDPEYSKGTFGVEIELAVEIDNIHNLEKSNSVIEDIKDLIEKNGFQVGGEEASGKTWGVGYDNLHDKVILAEDEKALVEIRTGILTLPELSDFGIFLEDLSAYVSNKRGVSVHGGTSAHVHISNKHVQGEQGKNYFTSLATALHMDEKGVKRDAGAGRDFLSWANFSPELFSQLYRILVSHAYQYNQPTYMTDQELGNLIKSIPGIKHHGINIAGKYPTIEYRYLSSQILSNPRKLLKWIEYYLVLPTAAKGKQQIRLWENPNKKGSSIVLTRWFGNRIRMDLNYKETRRIPLTGMPTKQLTQ